MVPPEGVLRDATLSVKRGSAMRYKAVILPLICIGFLFVGLLLLTDGASIVPFIYNRF